MNLNSEGLLTVSKQAELKPYVAREFKQYELMTDEEIWNNAGGNLIVDTENYENYFLIAFKSVEFQKYFLLEPPFSPQKLAWIIQSYRTVGFNSIKYDMPLIWLSYKTQDLEILKKASNDLIAGIFIKEFCNVYSCHIFDTKHVDLIEVCPLRGSLKLYGGRLHAPRIQDVPFNPYGELSQQQIDIVRDYCINDLDTTELQLNNLSEQLQLREQLSIQYKQDLMSKSDAQIAETVIGSELYRLTGKWPKRPQIDSEFSFPFTVPSNMFFQTDYMKSVLAKITNARFSLNENGRLEVPKEVLDLKIFINDGVYRMGIGGLHSSEKTTAYVSNEEYQIYDRDVASFYPEIVRKLKLFPKHLGQQFLSVYDSLVVRRLTAKEAGRIAESENLKITINGTFGKTGSPYSILYAPEMTIQITVGGQLYLLMFIEAMELTGIKVISANTDGIVMYIHKDQIEQYLSIVKWWEEITQFKTEETKYKALYSRDVNAYIAIKENGTDVKGKNILYDPWRGKSPKDKYWRFQKNPNAQICIEALELYITKGISIDETITQCQDITKFVCVKNVKGGAHKNHEYLGKVVRWYMAKNVTGTINYILSGNKVPDTDGAMPAMDLPKEFPDNINYDFYIQKTIDMLYDINYYQKSKQLGLF